MTLTLTENKPPTLCLNMIVKNESKIITRLFDTVYPIIDCYCICDTGSTDNTVNIITEYFEKKGIPGKIVVEPFVNFCHNRNFALNACIGMSDYVILLDADMILEFNNFNKHILKQCDSCCILQGNDSFHYQNLRIVKNNGLYSYVGVTHEYINTPENNSVFCFEKKDLFIRDYGDGGAKTDKFERDIRLLLNGIKDEPNNGRYYFYLANSYHDIGKFNEAIPIYLKRIEIGGWREEIWYSYYRIGLCYKNMDKIDDAIKYWLEGYEYYPERLEGMYEIIRYYRLTAKANLGYFFYKEAKRILDMNNKLDEYLFLHLDIYKSLIYYEFTIFAGYLNIKNIDFEIMKVLNNCRDESIVHNLLQNMKFYKNVLKSSFKIILDDKINVNIHNENISLSSSSSCLIPNINKDGYLSNIRYVNYYINEMGGYLNCDKHIISVNKFIELDTNFNLINEKWLQLDFDNRRYIGIEDIKIFHDVETPNLLFIGTGLHHNERIGIVSGNYDMQDYKFYGSEISQDFKPSICEKNWVYVDFHSSTHIIYDWHPLHICKLNNHNKLDIVAERETPLFFSRIRGSTCGFKYNKKIEENKKGNISISIEETEIWFVNHLVSYEDPRHYYHIISVFDADMKLLRYSAPFQFEGDPIEYCLSILVEDQRVLINYSNWDRTTRIGVYDKSYIDGLLKYT